jgi:spermidine synthase
MEQSADRGYGPHLIVDAYGCSRDALSDLGVIYSFLGGLAEVLRMQPITKPHVFRHLAEPDPDWGVTGGLFIATSHITIHTYPERGAAFMDAFSCMEFDEEKAAMFFSNVFRPERSDVDVKRRGLSFYLTAPVGPGS